MIVNNKIKLNKILIIGMLFVLLVMPHILSLGITPGRTTINYEKGFEQEVSFSVLNSEHKNMQVILMVRGELNDSITLYDSIIDFMPSEESKNFKYKIKLPDSIALDSGLHNAEIVAFEVPKKGSDGSYVGATVAVVSQIHVYVPCPGKCIDIDLNVLDASGIGEGGFSEENRLGVEKQMESAVLRSHKLDPKGNISVTFHSTVALPEMRPHIKKEGERIEEGLWIVDESSGQIAPIKPEERYFPEEGKFTGKKYKFQATKELQRKNMEAWTQSLASINRSADFGEEHLRRIDKVGIPKKILTNPEEFFSKVKDDEERERLKELYKDTERAVAQGQIYLRDSYKDMKDFFDKAWANVKNDNDKRKLEEFANKIKGQITPGIDTDLSRVEELRGIVSGGLNVLQGLDETPKIYKRLNDFVIEKSAQTFANVAESAYNSYGKTAPIVNIENPPAGTGLSTAEDMRKLVVDSRTQLTKNLINKRGMSKSEANAVAEKMIGATWDVGHINMLRKKGYTEKDVIEQTKIIAPYVKHVHLSDNFGLDHTELPMGMGNVPLKEHKEILKKAGFKGAEIVEAGNWWQHFAEQGGGNPFLASIEAFDSPIYSMMEGPGWANTGFYGGYFSGHGAINPPIHHNTYGAGFHTLPAELGGEMPGDRGRFAGTPNA